MENAEPEDRFILTFPMYALLFKDGTGTILLRDGQNMFIPLFTDSDSAQTYLERSEIKECLVQVLADAKALAAFLKNPPSRTGKNSVERVLIDPLHPEPHRITMFPIKQILDSIP